MAVGSSSSQGTTTGAAAAGRLTDGVQAMTMGRSPATPPVAAGNTPAATAAAAGSQPLAAGQQDAQQQQQSTQQRKQRRRISEYKVEADLAQECSKAAAHDAKSGVRLWLARFAPGRCRIARICTELDGRELVTLYGISNLSLGSAAVQPCYPASCLSGCRGQAQAAPGCVGPRGCRQVHADGANSL